MKYLFLFCTTIGSTLFSLASQAIIVQDYREVYQELSAQHGRAVVTVKFVMSVTASGKEDRVEDRTQALLVSADGLILVPDRAVSIDFNTIASGDHSQGNSAPVAKSNDFRVRLAGSDDWLPADLVTRDSHLGLAWLRLRQAPAGLDFVDLERGMQAAPGMMFFSLMRTSDEWGSVLVFRPGMVLGETRTPKNLFIADGVPGMAFSADGHPLGYADIDIGRLLRSRGQGSSLGLDVADAALQMIPIEKVAAATRQAAKLPSTNSASSASLDKK